MPPPTSQQPAPAPAPLPALPARILAYRRLHVCALAVLALDQLTKTWIAHLLPMPPGMLASTRHIEVIPGFFNLVHVGNTGAAWSILTDRGPLLALLAVAALAAVFFLRHAIGLRRRATQIAFGLLCGGIAGNLVDRIARGHVVDFFDFHLGDYTYPAFNVADSGICAGVVIYLLITLLTREPPPRNSTTTPPTRSNGTTSPPTRGMPR